MKTIVCAVFALIIVAPASFAADSCIDCHRKAAVPLDREHDYGRWEQSVHAKAGISCHDCHGGDPAQSGANAHKGVLASSDPESAIYFTRVPETCGRCHVDEFEAFRKSDHYKELQRSGKGPNCVTCHGSMANAVMTPQQMENTCSLCHRKPTGARPALMAMNNASSAVDRLGAVVRTSEDPKAKELHAALEVERQALLRGWHSFQLKSALTNAQALTKKAVAAIHALSGAGKPKSAESSPR